MRWPDEVRLEVLSTALRGRTLYYGGGSSISLLATDFLPHSPRLRGSEKRNSRIFPPVERKIFWLEFYPVPWLVFKSKGIKMEDDYGVSVVQIVSELSYKSQDHENVCSIPSNKIAIVRYSNRVS